MNRQATIPQRALGDKPLEKQRNQRLSALLILCFFSMAGVLMDLPAIAQNGYIYVHKKTFNEANQAFTFTGTGGIGSITLNDAPTSIVLKEIGAAQNGRLYAIGNTNNTLYYKDAGSATWIATSITTASRVDGGAGNTCYYINTSGSVFYFDGTTSTLIGASANYGSSAAYDIASAWDNKPYINNNSGDVWQYSGTGTVWTKSTTANSATNYWIDGNPVTGGFALVRQDKSVHTFASLSATDVSLGIPSGVSSINPLDVAVDASGTIYAADYITADGYGYVFKWTGAAWSANEVTSYNAFALTAGIGGQVWQVSFTGNILARATDGTTISWIFQEKVRTSPTGNAEMIAVAPGSYVITESTTAGYTLQGITLYDPTNNSSVNLGSNQATLNVAAGETVHAVYQNNPVAGTAFTCANNQAFQVEGAANETIYIYNLSNGTKAALATYPLGINNMGYSAVDNLLWAWDQTNNKVLRIDATGAYTSFSIPNLPVTGYNAGDILAGGYMLIYLNGQSTYYVVDINPARSTYLQLVDPTAGYILDTAPYGTVLVGGGLSLTDWAYRPSTGLLYGEINTGANQFKIATLNPTTGVVTYSPVITGSTFQNETTGFGSTFFDANGNILYLGGSTTGAIYAVNLTTNKATFLSNGGAVQNVDGASCPLAILAPPLISGTVWNDADGGLTLNGSEAGTNAGGPLYVNLVNGAGTVVASTTVAADGSYSLSGPASTTGLKLVLTNTATSTTPGTLPTGWVNTGENVGTSNTATQGTTLGVIELTTSTTGISGQNFGIEVLPTPGSGSATVANAGGTTAVTVPPSAFTSTTSSADTAPGSVTAIRITTFPSNVTSLTINGVTYTASSTAFTSGTGVVVATNSSGAPTVPILVDPTTDANPVTFTFVAVDNAGKESTTSGTAVINSTLAPIPFTCANNIAYQMEGTATTNVMYTYNLNTGAKTTFATFPNTFGINNIGYNVIDNLIWGFEWSTHKIIRIDATGAYTLFSIPNLPTNINFDAGDVITGGYLLIAKEGNPTYYMVDINPAHSTYLQLVDPTAGYILDTAPFGTSYVGGAINLTDWAFRPSTGLLYGEINTGANQFKIAALNPTSGVVTYSPVITGSTFQNETGGFGSTFFDANGNILYLGGSTTGAIYAVNLTTNKATFLANGGVVQYIDGASCPAAILAPPLISGTVWNDADGGLTLNGSETGTNAGGPLYVNLVNGSGTVIASTTVATDGTYSFVGPASTTGLKLVLTNTASSTTPGTLPTGWVNTGENVGTSNTATQGTTLGVIELTTSTTGISGQNFGIEQLPTPGSGSATVANAGGTTPVTVPPSAFTSTTSSADTAPGSVTAIRITTFPSNVTSLTINGVTYTASSTAFTSGTGVVVATDGSGSPTVPILVDPTNDSNPVSFSFVAVDNAGKESTTSGTAVINSTLTPPPTITGQVWNDADGSKTLNGAETGTNAGGPLFVNLVDATGTVVASTSVSASGSYTLTAPASTTGLKLVLTSTASSTAIGSLPLGWGFTGESVDPSNTATQSTTVGQIELTTGVTSVTAQNFGILQICNGGSIYVLTSSSTAGSGSLMRFTDPNTSGALSAAINTPFVDNISANAVGYNSVNGKFYFFQSPNNSPSGKTFRSYDPATNSYAVLTSPAGSSNIIRGGTTNNGLGYYGLDISGVLYYYNIATNAWTTITSTLLNQAGTNITSAFTSEPSGDLAIDGSGNMWILTSPGVGGSLHVYKINGPLPTTAQASLTAVVVATVTGGFSLQANGIAFSSTGEVFITTSNGNLFRLNNDFSITDIGAVTGATGGPGDLAGCAFPLTPLSALEFGDAPDSYGTLQASSGARHALSFYDGDLHTSKLMLGSLLDVELNGVPATAGATATGDDQAGVDDEDAITTFPVLNTGVSSYTLTLAVSNTTGATANLKGWIDFNKNGVFDASEGATATVANGATTATLTWSGLSGLTTGNTYARFRIATLASEITNPTGAAADGEVEDYQLAITLAVSGNVYNDANGLTDGTINGTATNAGGTLNAILYDNSTNQVVGIVPVAADGTYILGATPGDTYNVYLTTATATVGQSTTPTVSLPSGWVTIGEHLGTGTGTDLIPNGVLPIGVVSAAVTNANFGIEQLPVAGSGSNTVANAGGTTPVTVPANTFTNTTPSTDTAPGSVSAIRITTFPSNVTSLTINGTVYTASSTEFTSGTGVVVATDLTGAPTVPILVDPTNDSNPVSFSFVAIDNAGKESANTGTAVINSTLTPTPTITGQVWNDADGSKTLNGAETGTNAGGPLFVNLVDATGTVVASTSVSASGSYTLTAPASTTGLKLVLTSTASSTAIGSLPLGWGFTGESVDPSNTATQSTTVGQIELTTGVTSVTAQNFGILQICNGGSIYVLTSSSTAGSGSLMRFTDPNTSGALSAAINTPFVDNISANAVGYNSVNGKFYFFQSPNNSPSGKTFRSYDPATNSYAVLTSPAGSSNIIRGGTTNNGLGYYGLDISGVLYYYNIATNAWTTITSTLLNQAGTNITSAFTSEPSGDLAIDGSGNMWILTSPGVGGSLHVYKINGPLPTTAQASLTAVVVATVTGGFSLQANGIAFSSTGEVFITTSNGNLFRLNNDFSITDIGAVTGATGGPGDLAGCAFPLTPLSALEFGDAPDSYGTLQASSGAVMHFLSMMGIYIHPN
jgi:hypothetical protein